MSKYDTLHINDFTEPELQHFRDMCNFSDEELHTMQILPMMEICQMLEKCLIDEECQTIWATQTNTPEVHTKVVLMTMEPATQEEDVTETGTEDIVKIIVPLVVVTQEEDTQAEMDALTIGDIVDIAQKIGSFKDLKIC